MSSRTLFQLSSLISATKNIIHSELKSTNVPSTHSPLSLIQQIVLPNLCKKKDGTNLRCHKKLTACQFTICQYPKESIRTRKPTPIIMIIMQRATRKES